MKVKKAKIELLIKEIDHLIKRVSRAESKSISILEKVHPNHTKSAINLIHYRALRSQDISETQKKLGTLGLSRLAKAESHVMASLTSTRGILESMISSRQAEYPPSFLSVKKGQKLIRAHSKALLGYRSKGRRVRIMVTLPTEAAHNYQLIHDLVESGMNSARINCAHDGPEVWSKMVSHIRLAGKRLRRNVKICMDLGGPKIRTGAMRQGPQVSTFAPERDSLGRVIGPAVLHLRPTWGQDFSDSHPIPLPTDVLKTLSPQELLFFEDTRGKKRHMKIIEADDEGWIAHCYDRAYVQTGMILYREDGSQVGAIGEIPPIEEKILLKEHDILVLHRDSIDGEPAHHDEDGNLLRRAHISCTSSEVFDRVRLNERILFDDGKVVGQIIHIVPESELHVKVLYARRGGQKLRADKGINFPDSNLQIRGLTQKDRRDLKFVVEHADVVNMSFVNSPEDVEDLLEALRDLDAIDKIGVILKIETQQGFDNLTEILLSAMQIYPVGVMIARGDLAVEVGWQHMPRIQEEIMALCLAAHMPDIWATQVLENLAKKGIPSRAEITDAARAQRAECVMLNKGPYIVNAIQMLDHILKEMKDYQDKNAPLLPALQ